MQSNSGEFTTILGPSGSGKTTMLSMIAGIASPTSGGIQIGDREITQVPAAQRNIGLVFQSYALFPHMTIVRQHRLSAARSAAPPRAEIGRPRRRGAAPGAARPVSRSAGRTSSRAASSSGWRWPARWSSSPTSCCSTSPWRARPQAARRGAARDPGAPARARHHHHHGHARPGGGAVAVRPDRAPGRRAASSRSARRTRSTTARRRALLPASWDLRISLRAGSSPTERPSSGRTGASLVRARNASGASRSAA